MHKNKRSVGAGGVKVIYWIYFFLTLAFYAKPLYWLGRITYLYYSDFKGDIQTEDPRIIEYKSKIKAWFKTTWDSIKWQKQDM